MLVNNPTLKNIKDAIESLSTYADINKDSINSLSTQVSQLGTMSLVNDAPIDGDAYVRKNGNWAISSGGSGGGIGLGDTVAYGNDNDLLITSGVSTAQELYDIDSDAFSPAINYNIGDYTIYGGKLYRFIANHTAGSWNSSDAIVVNVTNELKNKILYFADQSVSVTTNDVIFTINDNRITENTILLNCNFVNPEYVASNIQWSSHNGYISFSSSCTVSTTANVTLGQKGN